MSVEPGGWGHTVVQHNIDQFALSRLPLSPCRLIFNSNSPLDKELRNTHHAGQMEILPLFSQGSHVGTQMRSIVAVVCRRPSDGA
jgi:hypothetical protein